MIKRTKRGFRVNLGRGFVIDFTDLSVAWTFAFERLHRAPEMRIKPYPVMIV